MKRKNINELSLPREIVRSDKLDYKTAWDNVGGLSRPSKMPCYGWGISALLCKVGSKLAQKENTVCSGCYALRGNYRFACVQNAMKRRLAKFYTPAFVPSMVYLIRALGMSHFRWFDSGDIQDSAMLARICEVATLVPDTKFWLPTKEYKIVQNYILAGNSIPPNLNVRLSGYVIDSDGPNALAKRLDLTTSEVRRENYTCPASRQDTFCGTCRACWDSKVFTVAYKKH